MSKCFLARQETAGRLNQVVQTSSNIGPWWGLIYQIGRHLTLLGYLFPRGHLSLSVWSLLSIPDAIYSWVALSVVTLLVLSFFKTLLRHGANPDLRDEDGKTPMDKARERNDEGHREVVHILQSPGIVFFLLWNLKGFSKPVFRPFLLVYFAGLDPFFKKFSKLLEPQNSNLATKLQNQNT